jgi:hypothetical protein
MASALIAVQIALCAVIGFVTFGTRHHAHQASSGGRALADAPGLIPPATAGPPGLSAAGPATSSSPTKRKSSKTTAPKTVGALPPSPPSDTGQVVAAPGMTPSKNDPQAIEPSPLGTAPEASRPPPAPAPSPTGSVQTGVKISDPCNPRGALGRTKNGVAVLCVADTDGQLRWQ